MRGRLVVVLGAALAAGAIVVWALGDKACEPASEDPSERALARAGEPPPTRSLEGRVGEARAGGRGAATEGAGSAASEPARAQAARRVAGDVVGADGKPLPGALVKVVGSGDAEPTAVTDAEGRFALETTAPAESLLSVSAPGHPEVRVALGKPGTRLRVPLVPGWMIAGTVKDAATGERVVGVRVSARPAAAPETPIRGEPTWREDGTFSVTVPAQGAYVLELGSRWVDADSGPEAEWIATRVEGVTAGTSDLVVTLTRGLSIEGRILDEAGNPALRTVMVDAIGRTRAGDPDYTTRRIAYVTTGELRLPGLRPGRYDLWIRPAREPADAAGADVSATLVRDVEAGTKGLTIRLSRGLVLEGRLEDGRGGAVTDGGYVYAYPEGEMGTSVPVTGEVPHDDTFRIGPLEDGKRYDLLATGFPRRHQARLPRVGPRDRDVVLYLASAGRISGRIEAPDGIAVPAGVPIGVIGEGADPAAPGARLFVYTTAGGAFVADGLGDFKFSLEAGGGRSGYLGKLVTTVEVGTQDLVLHVFPGVALAGLLVDAEGAPVSTTSLQADDGARMAAMRPYTQVGPDGRFVLSGLRAGRVRLSARVRDAWIALGEFDAPASEVRVTVPD